MVTETSARSVLIGHDFIECCFWRTLNLTHKGTPANPGVRFRPDEEGSISGDMGAISQHSHYEGCRIPSHPVQGSSVGVCLHADSCFVY